MIKALLIVIATYAAISLIGLIAIRCIFGLTEPLPLPPGERRHSRSAL